MSTRAPRKKAKAAPKAKPAVKKKARARPRAPKQVVEAAKVFPLEIDPTAIEETLGRLRTEVVHWTNKGRYTRVRLKFRGRQLLPDLPLAVFVAAEGLSFYWAGILRLLLVNLAGGALLEVELVNDADKQVLEGREALLSGDLDRALELFQKAISMDRDNAPAHLNLGVALKLKGDRDEARTALEKALALDPEGVTGAEAGRVLSTLPGAP